MTKLKCKSRCSEVKPKPPESYGLELDYTKSYYENDWGQTDNEGVKQDGKIIYKCKDPKAGIAWNYTGLVDSGQWEGSQVGKKQRKKEICPVKSF